MIERYTLPEIGKIWSEENKFATWLEIEILACEARAEAGEIPREVVKEIRNKAKFDVKRILEIEEDVKHDVIAFLTNVAENVGDSAKHIHYGMTSSDILDTALAVQMKQAGELILKKLKDLTNVLAERAKEFKNTVMIGRSHGIHAEPVTFGLKLANFYAEMVRNIERWERALEDAAVGQVSGAVGTFDYLSPDVEAYVCNKLGLKPADISTQVVQRDHHAYYMTTLAVIAATMEKISVEIRHLQRTEVLEAEEGFGKKQKGSSAMPHKKNPIISERITGMARLIRTNAQAALENVALWHERDISHSSVERIIMPDTTMLVYYMLEKSISLITNLNVYSENMEKNLNLTRGLIFSQSVLLALTKAGVSREKAYRIVQRNAMQVWEGEGEENFETLLLQDEEILQHISKNEIKDLCSIEKKLKNVNAIFK
ncbi:MAG: adenylosuccinate lyase, partial [Calditrichia bacterium]|nr:adenylosuccinate lyase [Calditrichia bacterium]